MCKSPVAQISKAYSENRRQFRVTVVKHECGHLIRKKAAQANRAEQRKPSTACISFRKVWKAVDHFNEGMA